jgi:hypothetical protein
LGSTAAASLNFNVGNLTQSYSFTATGSSAGENGSIVSFSPGVVGDIREMTLQFSDSRLPLLASMIASADCGVSRECYTEAQFLNSLRFIGAVVRDTEGSIVNSAFLGSDSGFDYIEGVEPHSSVTPVPVPASGMLMLVGILSLLRMRKAA